MHKHFSHLSDYFLAWCLGRTAEKGMMCERDVTIWNHISQN